MSLQDGSGNYGVQPVTINAVVYIAENINVTRGGSRSETRDGDNEVNSQYFSNEQPSGSCTLQMEDPAVIPPQNDQTAVFALTTTSGVENWIVMSVGEVFTQGEAAKINVDIQKCITLTPTL